jgi:hypothetical protein
MFVMATCVSWKAYKSGVEGVAVNEKALAIA